MILHVQDGRLTQPLDADCDLAGCVAHDVGDQFTKNQFRCSKIRVATRERMEKIEEMLAHVFGAPRIIALESPKHAFHYKAAGGFCRGFTVFTVIVVAHTQ